MNELRGTVLRFCGRETNKKQRRFYDCWEDKVKFAALTPPDKLRRYLEEMYFSALLLMADEPSDCSIPPPSLLSDAELTALRSDIERAREMMHSVSVRLANYAKGEIK